MSPAGREQPWDMMPGVVVLAASIGFSIIGSFGGLLLASSVLLVRDEIRNRLVSWLISFAVGTLLGAAVLRLLPEALEEIPSGAAFASLLCGIMTFFVLEKLVLWRHCHEADDCAVHDTAASLVIVGDAFHTFVDGALITAATLTSIPLGLSTAIAAAAHEVPQEMGDFAVLLHAGYSRRRALTLNVLSGVAGIVGAVAVYYATGPIPRVLPYILAFAAGCFLYVALTDLIPGLHRGQIDRNPFRQIVLIACGLAVIATL
jgi:zinc and cadmium transporter